MTPPLDPEDEVGLNDYWDVLHVRDVITEEGGLTLFVFRGEWE